MLTESQTDAVPEGDEIYSPPPTHPLLVTVVLGLLALAALGSIQWWVGEAGIDDGVSASVQVAVPRLIGLPEEEATAALSDAGFEVDVTRVPNVRVERGLVFDQAPVAGEQADPGLMVTITVSTGGDIVVVPEITGSLVGQIELQLVSYGLGVGQVSSRQDLNSLEGEILEQFPPPGEEVALGSVVDVVVSEGPPPVKVPDVRGLTEGEATRLLSDAGFVVDTARVYSSARSGTVVSTSPRADTELEYGSEVRLFVSRGAAPTTVPPPTTTPEPSEPEEPDEPATPPSSTPPSSTPPPAPSGQGGGSQGGGSQGGGSAGGAASD